VTDISLLMHFRLQDNWVMSVCHIFFKERVVKSVGTPKLFFLSYSKWHIVDPSTLNKRNRTGSQRGDSQITSEFRLKKSLQILWRFSNLQSETMKLLPVAGIATDVT